MYGKKFTLIGLLMLFIGLILYTVWIIGYTGEKTIENDGKITKYSTGETSLFIIGFMFSFIGVILCFFGFVQSVEYSKKEVLVDDKL